MATVKIMSARQGCLAMSVCWIAIAFPQQTVPVAGERSDDQIVAMDADGKMRSLERVATHKEKRGSIIYTAMEGEHSPVAFPDGHNVTFLVRTASKPFDPQSDVKFFRLTQQEGQRRIELAIGKTTTEPISAVRFGSSPAGQNTFRIKASADLGPGEYILFWATVPSKEGFCFSVGDPRVPAAKQLSR